jgi:transposase
VLFVPCVRRFAAQVDNGGDAEFLEFGEIRRMRLRAAKKLIGNFSGVVNARNGDFFSEGSVGGRSSNGGLPKWNGERETRKTQSKEENNLHRELARKSLGGRRKKRKKKRRKFREKQHHKIWAIEEKVI